MAAVTPPYYRDEWDTFQTEDDLRSEAIQRGIWAMPRKFLWLWERWGWIVGGDRTTIQGWAYTAMEAVLKGVLVARWAERYGHPIGHPTGTVGKGCPDCVKGLWWAYYMEAWIECPRCDGNGILPE